MEKPNCPLGKGAGSVIPVDGISFSVCIPSPPPKTRAKTRGKNSKSFIWGLFAKNEKTPGQNEMMLLKKIPVICFPGKYDLDLEKRTLSCVPNCSAH